MPPSAADSARRDSPLFREVRWAPAARRGLGGALASGLREGLKRFRRDLRRGRSRFSEEAVHDLRVGVRRLLALLGLLREHLPRRRIRKVRRDLRRVLRAFGPLRDLQVLREHSLRAAVARPALRPLLEIFPGRLRTEETRARKRLARIRTDRLRRRADRLMERIEAGVARRGISREVFAPASAVFAKALARARRRAEALNPADMFTVHRLRIAFKRVRYMAQALHPQFRDFGPEDLRRLTAFQTLMGDVHDLEVVAAGISAWGREAAEAPVHTAAEAAATDLRRRRDAMAPRTVELAREILGAPGRGARRGPKIA